MKATLKPILRFIKPYRMQLAVIIAVLAADVGGSLLVPTITANMINHAVGGGTMEKIVADGILMLLISLVSGALTLLGSWLSARVSANLGRDLRCSLYDKSLAFSGTDFESFGTASMITRTLNDINVIQQAFINFVQMVLPVPIMCVLGIAFSFAISQKMGFLVLGATIFIMLVALLIMRKAAPIFEKLQEFLDRMNVVLRENLTGVRVVRAFNKQQPETKRMKKTFMNYAEASIRANRLFAGLDCLATVLINFCIVAILYLGADDVGAGRMEIGDITAVTEYAIWILFYVMMAQMVILLIPRALTCLRRVEAVLMLEPEIQDGDKLTESQAQQSASEDEKTVVRFDHASFRFSDADEETLYDISFTCRRGETTAVIGGTGSGKSTLVKLLLRFHDVREGRKDLSRLAGYS